MRTWQKQLTLTAIVCLALFNLSAAPSDKEEVPLSKDRYEDLQVFTKVLNLVQQYYVEDVDMKKLVYGGVKGMLRDLDPHTNFLTPSMYKEFESETSGEFGGIGIEITVQDGNLSIISPIEDTPAWTAGIKAGDRVLEIDGKTTKGFSLAEAAQVMRGKKGTKVRLKIMRDGFDQPKIFEIVRTTVKVKSVKYTDLGDGYAYIRLTSFIENSASEVEKALQKHLSANKETRGLIIDLRRNPGGLLDQAVRISDLFLKSGKIVTTMGRGGKERDVVEAKDAGTLPEFPVAVLINEYSASASEILAGALQDNHRAVIMGKRSFGKGSVQSVIKLSDGSALKLTIARYYTPSGRSIQAEGIKPDIVIDEIEAENLEKAIVRRDVRREADMAGHLKGENEKDGGKIKYEEDSLMYWYAKSKDRKESELTPKEKLLAKDFQLVQAFNHLRSIRALRSQ
jgi:carboxyl-terminal processing protease